MVAKVYRDLLMESYHDLYPVYDFRHNRGYATEGHQAALRLYGPSPIHRKSFEGVDEPMLLQWTERLGAQTLDPIKTTNVQHQRCMTTWCLLKPA